MDENFGSDSKYDEEHDRSVLYDSLDNIEDLNALIGTSSTISPSNSEPLVKSEEICIIILILILWAGAIALFFNRWGKIRMLEPYQPKFCESHRPSCPIVATTSTNDPIAPIQHFQKSLSKYNLTLSGNGIGNLSGGGPLEYPPQFPKCSFYYEGNPIHHGRSSSVVGTFARLSPSFVHRQRQNSMFTGYSGSCSVNVDASKGAIGGSGDNSSVVNSKLLSNITSRKAKSAIDLPTLVLSEQFMENVRRNSKNSVTQV